MLVASITEKSFTRNGSFRVAGYKTYRSDRIGWREEGAAILVHLSESTVRAIAQGSHCYWNTN
jgi:hypothetical protein